MPGILTRTGTRSGPALEPRAPSGRWFTVGIFERGPVDVAVEVRSMAEVRATFGEAAFDTLSRELGVFFDNLDDGNGVPVAASAVLVRAVGPGATVGTRALDDGEVGATAVGTINAANPGAWSARLTTQVLAPPAGAAAGAFGFVVRYDGDIVHQWRNLANFAELVARLEASGDNGSPWVRAVDAGHPTGAAPAVDANPVALSAGTDDRANATATVHADQLDELAGEEFGDGFVAVPGIPALAIAARLQAHAEANSRITGYAAPAGSTVDDVEGLVDDLRALGVDEYGGVFYPGLLVSDGAGGTAEVTPLGFVAAARARAHDVGGPWLAPPGIRSKATSSILGVAERIDRTTGDRLDAAGVSAIRVIARSIRLYGWRSLSLDLDNYELLTGRDVLNRVEVGGDRALEPLVWDNIDGRGRFAARARNTLKGFLDPMRAAGGLYEWLDDDGNVIDPGYSIVVDAPVGNRVVTRVAVRPSPTAALIELEIVKVGLTAAV